MTIDNTDRQKNLDDDGDVGNSVADRAKNIYVNNVGGSDANSTANVYDKNHNNDLDDDCSKQHNYICDENQDKGNNNNIDNECDKNEDENNREDNNVDTEDYDDDNY